MARVLVTRPAADADALAAVLEKRGHHPVLTPLLIIENRNVAIDTTGAQAILFTSANGVRAVSGAFSERSIPVFCVGDATAQEALTAGFSNVESAAGDVETLTSLASDRCTPGGGRLIHIAGSKVAGDLSATLQTLGFTVDRIVLYDAKAPETLPQLACDGLTNGTIDAVLLFSPRTAATFAALVRKANLAPACQNVDMLCLSQNAADALGDLPHRQILVPAQPNRDALIDLI